MSTNLYYRKVIPARHKTLATGLKWAISKHYGNGPTVLTIDDILFLEGIQAAQGTSSDDSQCNEIACDCQKLIDAIRDNSPHGIEVWIAE